MQRKPKVPSAAGFGVVPPYQPNVVARVKIWIPPVFTSKKLAWDEELPPPSPPTRPPTKKRSYEEFSQPAEPELHSFRGEDIGGYPPRAEEIVLFHDLKRRRGQRFALPDIEEDENSKVLAEKEMRSMEGVLKPRPPEVGKGPRIISLSIDLFDNPEVDLKHPSIDIREAQERGEKGAPGRARFYTSTGVCQWAPCYVMEYDQKTDTYVVEFVSNKKKKRIKRLSFILDRESERGFVARVFAAKDLRTRIETQMRFSAYVEEHPFRKPETINDELLRRVLLLSGIEMSKKFPSTVTDYFEEMKRDYRLSVNSAILKHRFELNKDERVRFDALLIFFKLKQEAAVPSQGCVPLVFELPYFFVREKISRTLCVAEEAFLLGLQLYHREMDICKVPLTSPSIYRDQKPWSLHDFRSTQEEHITETVEYLKNE